MSHPAVNLYSITHWLIKTIISYVRRHPFFCGSLVIHSAILYLLYSYGSYTVDLQKHQQAQVDVTQSVQKAQQKDMQKRIDDMEKIKNLLERSANKKVTASPEADSDNQVEPESSPGEKSPAELLAKAQEMSHVIKAIEKDIKAEELTKLLNIPKEEALKKIEEKLSEPQEKTKKPESDEALAVKKLEAEARSTLEQRKKDLDAKKSGTKIELAQESQSDKKNQNDKSDAKRGSGSKGEGENGKADGAAHQQGENKKGGGANGNGMHGDGGGLPESGLARDTIEDDQLNSEEIDEFLVESSYAMGNENKFFDASMGHIPEVKGGERKQAGRIIGAGGYFAERIYLNSWYVIGPFKGNSDAALYKNPSYPPEQLVDLDAVYFGKDERILKWQYVVRGSYPFVPPDLAEDSVYYGYTEMSLENAQDLWMWCGADDDMQVWLNEHLVWAGGNIAKQNFFDTIYIGSKSYRKNWNLTEGKRLVHFQQGRNKLLFKLSNGPNRVGIFASIILTH